MKKLILALSVWWFAVLIPIAHADSSLTGWKVTKQVVVTTSTTSTQVASADRYRRFMYFYNSGATTVFVKFGGANVTTEGLVLPAATGFQSNFASVDSIFVLAASGTPTLEVILGD